MCVARSVRAHSYRAENQSKVTDDDRQIHDQIDSAGTNVNRFANAQSVSDIIDQLAADAVVGDRAGIEQRQQIAAEAKERLVELGMANFS